MSTTTTVRLSTIVIAAAVIVAIPSSGSAVCAEPWMDVAGGMRKGHLWDVTAIDAAHAWAVGYRIDRDGNERPLIQRWDGSTWSVETLPRSPLYSTLYAVEALSPTDVWASGTFYDEAQDRHEPTTLRSDGTGWEEVPTPFARSGRITDIVGFGSDDVWATGWRYGSGEYRPWLLQWDGEAWVEETGVPDPDGEEFLYGIDGTSEDDLWVVGDSSAPGDGGLVIFHRSPGGWEQAPPPSVPADPDLIDVAAISTDEAYAVGNVRNAKRPLVLRWNGRSWRKTIGPEMPDGGALGTIDGHAGDDLTVAGNLAGGIAFSAHWNGVAWTTLAIPEAHRRGLSEVAVTTDDAAFLAGVERRRTGVLQRCAGP